jgi:hypothetical protein
VDDHLFTTSTKEPKKPAIRWTVFPNPFSETATIVVQGANFGAVNLLLYDLTGRLVKTQSFTGSFAQIQKGGLSPGLYFYEIEADGRQVGNGKLAVD